MRGCTDRTLTSASAFVVVSSFMGRPGRLDR
jgi:hypothetical protein